MTSEEEFEARRHANYLKERDSLIKAEWEQAAQQDKYLLTLSAGVFSVSIAFLDKIAKQPRNTCLLITAWWFFVITIVCTLISFVLSQSASRRQRDIIDDAYKNKTEDIPKPNGFSEATKVMNYISFSLFVVGLIFLTIFISLNVSQ